MTTLRHNVDLPIRPSNSDVTMGRVGRALEFRRRTHSRFSRGFLWFWLAGWSTTCVLLVLLVAREPHPVHFLFSLPFWGFWIYVLFLVLDHAFGRERLRVSQQGIEYWRTALVPLVRRRVPVWNLGRIGEYARVTDRQTGRRECGVCVETSGRPLIFAMGAAPEERAWLTHAIRAHFGLLEADDPATDDGAAPVVARASEGPAESPCAAPAEENLALQTTRRVERPAGSQWTTRRGNTGPRFVWRGRWRWRTLALLTLLNLGCVGLLGLVRMTPAGGRGFALSMVAACAYLMLGVFGAAWLLSIALRFTRREWVLGREEIITRLSVFGVCYAKWHPVDRVTAVRVRRADRITFNADLDLRAVVLSVLLGRDTSLLLLNDEGRALTTLRALTPAEARWIGYELLRTYARKTDQLSA